MLLGYFCENMDALGEVSVPGKKALSTPSLHSLQIVWPSGSLQRNSTKEKCFLHLALQVSLIWVWGIFVS